MATYRRYPVQNSATGYKWMYQVDLGRDPETKKRIRVSKRGFDTKKAAIIDCTELITKHRKGEAFGASSK